MSWWKLGCGIAEPANVVPTMTDEEAAIEVVWIAHEARALVAELPPLSAPDEIHEPFAERVAEFQVRKAALLAYLGCTER